MNQQGAWGGARDPARLLAGEERGDPHGVAWLGHPAWRCLLPHLAWGEG